MTMDKEITGFNLNEHFLLRKIIIPRSIPLEDLDDWAMSKKIWFDPKDYSSKPQYLIWLPNIKYFAKNIIFLICTSLAGESFLDISNGYLTILTNFWLILFKGQVISE